MKCQCGNDITGIGGWFTFMEGCQIAERLKYYTHRYCEKCKLHLFFDRKGELKGSIKFTDIGNGRVQYKQEIF